MSVVLNNPKQTITLDRARVAAIKIEENPYRGRRWIEFWVVFGRVVGDNFEEFIDPDPSKPDHLYIKIEDGFHPLSPGMALGKCDTCGKWFKGLTSGNCDADGCDGTILPYDGWSRMAFMPSQGRPVFVEIQDSCYTFFTNEIVPDPDTWEEIKILDAQWGT